MGGLKAFLCRTKYLQKKIKMMNDFTKAAVKTVLAIFTLGISIALSQEANKDLNNSINPKK